jgi:hypothetical protein
VLGCGWRGRYLRYFTLHKLEQAYPSPTVGSSLTAFLFSVLTAFQRLYSPLGFRRVSALNLPQPCVLPRGSSGCPSVQRVEGNTQFPGRCHAEGLMATFPKVAYKGTAAKLAVDFFPLFSGLRSHSRGGKPKSAQNLRFSVVAPSDVRLQGFAIPIIQTPWLFDFLRMLPSPVSGSFQMSWLLGSIGYHTRA